MGRSSQARIESISVERLFGFLSYQIPVRSHENLVILYGDNGSGKTTILNLVFHALSAEGSKGHRGFIARTPLKQLTIAFAGGHQVSVERETATTGPFSMTVRRRGRTLASHEFVVGPDGAVPDQAPGTYHPLLQALSDLSLGLFLLPDSRRIEGNLIGDDETPRRRHVTQHQQLHLRFAARGEEDTEDKTIDTFVREALRRSVQWARRQALTAASQGETDTTKLYADILSRIASRASRPKSSENIPYAALQTTMEDLRERSLGFSRFGLVTPFTTGDLISVVRAASPGKKSTISQVLSPYLRSFEARLNALDQLRESLETFSDIFARFYNYKALTFDVGEGVNIQLRHDHSRLAPDVLSSGEKQLLLLFCNVLLARSRPSVFIIDEPELSLNVKWQRELIASLMACVKECDVQFVLATHSLEMIALHRASAVRLGNTG